MGRRGLSSPAGAMQPATSGGGAGIMGPPHVTGRHLVTHTNSTSDSGWPPRDAATYVRSETFASLIEELAVALQAAYPGLDLVGSVGLVWDWFERRAAVEPGFFSTPGRFRDRAALRA